MPTGAGKTLCFQLPTLVRRNKLCIVILPLISLMENQAQAMQQRNLKYVMLNSRQTEKDRRAAIIQLRSNEANFLLLSPEMLITPKIQNLLTILAPNIFLFAIDEAHCIQEWGDSFRSAYAKLSLIRENFPKIPILAMTASMNKDTITRIKNCLKLGTKGMPLEVLTSSVFRKNIFYEVIFKDLIDDPLDDLILFVKDINSSMIVYCHMRETCEMISNYLEQRGIASLAYHAGMSGKERSLNQSLWQTGSIKVIVATVSFGMGIDKQDVRAIVHWNVPKSVTSYYQECGRSGRSSDNKSRCRLYYSRADRSQMEFILSSQTADESMNDAASKKIEDRQNFMAMIKYCEGFECRHSFISKYFSDTSTIYCKKMCDYCNDPKRLQLNLNLMKDKSIMNNLSKSKKIHQDYKVSDHEDLLGPREIERDFDDSCSETKEDKSKQDRAELLSIEFAKRSALKKTNCRQEKSKHQLASQANSFKKIREYALKNLELNKDLLQDSPDVTEKNLFSSSANNIALYRSKVASLISSFRSIKKTSK
ncbi:MAG: ATP-dependent DNA helicase Q5, variant 3 [Marteilia pararefringens]